MTYARKPLSPEAQTLADSNPDFPVSCIYGLDGSEALQAMWDRIACVPIHAGSKIAATTWKDVTAGEKKIEGEQFRGANYGVLTGPRSGLVVVDLDTPEAIAAFHSMGTCPETYTQGRVDGREQRWFDYQGSDVRNSASLLAPNIDIRGDGGLVVGPGSIHASGAAYVVTKDVPPAPLPTWLRNKILAAAPTLTVATPAAPVEAGTAVEAKATAEARQWLASAPVSINGQGGDSVLWSTARHLVREFELPMAAAHTLLSQWNAFCQPPWDDTVLVRNLERAATESTTPTRTERLTAEAEAEAFRQMLKAARETPAEQAPAQTTRLTPQARARRVGGDLGARYETGLPTVDKATRGGFMKAKFAVIGGAPGAGKTALAVGLAYKWLTEGKHVAVLAADEDADALLIRFGQQAGIRREALEHGDPEARERLASWCDSVSLILVDGDEGTDTIESLSEELRDAAKGEPSILVVDSIQTARSRTSDEAGLDKRAKVGRAVAALKMAAKRDGHFVLATSELARGSYRSKKQSENSNLLSSFKEAGEIEYGVTFAMGLVSRSGSSSMVEAEIVKNRLGTKGELVLQLDHLTAAVVEIDDQAEDDEGPEQDQGTGPDLRSRMLLALETGNYSSQDKLAADLGVRATAVRAEMKDLIAKAVVAEVKQGRGKVFVVDNDGKRLARVLASINVHRWNTVGKLADHAGVPLSYVEDLIRTRAIRPRMVGREIDGFMASDDVAA